MNLYVVGHGYIVRTVSSATVPAGFTLTFYCKEDTEFDSSWEPDVASGKASATGFAPGRGLGQWQVTTLAAGATYIDHLLTRPGGMKTQKSLKDTKEIDTNVAEGCLINVPLQDEDALCIKAGGKLMTGGFSAGRPSVFLSEIFEALVESGKAGGGATIHWCACRSTDGDRSEMEAQARGAWGGKL